MIYLNLKKNVLSFFCFILFLSFFVFYIVFVFLWEFLIEFG
jgi:hypothetical protein